MPARTSMRAQNIFFNTRSWARFIHVMFSITRIRRVGLVSLGDEDVKGTELTKEVFKMLKPSSLNFRRQHRRPAFV